MSVWRIALFAQWWCSRIARRWRGWCQRVWSQGKTRSLLAALRNAWTRIPSGKEVSGLHLQLCVLPAKCIAFYSNKPLATPSSFMWYIIALLSELVLLKLRNKMEIYSHNRILGSDPPFGRTQYATLWTEWIINCLWQALVLQARPFLFCSADRFQ